MFDRVIACHMCVCVNLCVSTVDIVYYPLADLTMGFMLTASVRSVSARL